MSICVTYKGHCFSVNTAEEVAYLMSILPVVYGDQDEAEDDIPCGTGSASDPKKPVNMTVSEDEDYRLIRQNA